MSDRVPVKLKLRGSLWLFSSLNNLNSIFCVFLHLLIVLGDIILTTQKNNMIIPTYNDVLIAHKRIKPYIHQTPVLTSRFLNDLTGAELFFKCENLQRAGAFKARGASNAVFSLTEKESFSGVATHSSGNHALSLSYAAGQRGIPVTVVMPYTSPQAKKDAVRGYGGTIIECEPSASSRESVFADVLANSGADFVHPYNDPRVIAGQATCSKELLSQVTGLDAIIAPIGGGGMISGTCLTTSNINPKIKVYAAAPLNADDTARSFRAGYIISDDAPETIADGLKMPLRDLTWHFVSNHVENVFTATEDEITNAMKLIWSRMKILIEPSSAVPLATILKNPDVFRGMRLGVIITGGNVDLNKLPWLKNSE
jgi:threonine dehydratase|tara:strand:- start:6180 stop:7286 length:1107 start_codon:yes stop_codon:yes gene_type:complete